MNDKELLEDKKFLKDFVERLKKTGFSFEKSVTRYNPIEIFLDQVSKKEDAHSDIIAGLLNPQGSHRQGNVFLKEFIEKSKLDIPIEEIDWESISVTREKGVYNEKGSLRRIDILVKGSYQNKKSFALIIENKLNGAGYQPNQLEDYRQSLIQEIGDKANVFVVCLLAAEYQKNKAADKSFFPNEIGEMIESAFKSNEKIISVLKSYTFYLSNLSKKIMNLDNAKKLASLGLTRDDLKHLRVLSDAYMTLPKAYSHTFIEEYVKKEFSGKEIENKKYKYEISKSNPDYCFIWNEESYKQTWQFLAVRFYEDRVTFYLVSNDSNKNDSEKKAANIHFNNPELGWGWSWYTYNGSASNLCNEIQFTEKEDRTHMPDYEKIWRTTKLYLDLLDDTGRILNGLENN